MNLSDIRNAKDLRGKKVLLRASLNVPAEDGNILNDFRLKRALKTILFLKDAGAKTIIIGHIGRAPSLSLKSVYEYLKQHIPLVFTGDIFGQATQDAIKEMNNGDIVLLENLRSNVGEQSNDDNFAKQLSALADIYINDAFSVSHREHSSIMGIPKHLPSYAGILMQEEIKELSRARSPLSPSLCILGGAKFKTKEPLIRKFLNVYDKVFIGGALAHSFFKAKGFNIGTSVVSDTVSDIADLLNNEKLMLPLDVTVRSDRGVFVKKPDEVSDGENISDAGSDTIEKLKKTIGAQKFILWNGPLGEYERGFEENTKELAKAIARSEAQSIIGGEDTIASIAELNLESEFSFISTGGGAMLEFLLNGTLVGIEALRKIN